MRAFFSTAHSVLESLLTPVSSALSLGRLPALHAPASACSSDCGCASASDHSSTTSTTKTNMSRCAKCAAAQNGRCHDDHGNHDGHDCHVQRQADRLAALPDKLLAIIFDLLARQSRPDLCSMSLVSKKYHALADAALYRTLLFDSPEQHLIFSETLDRRPRRGSMIHDVVLAYPTSELSHLILDAPLDRSHYDPDRIDGLSRTLSAMSNLETLDVAVPVKLLHGIGTLFNGPFDLACLKTCTLFYQCPGDAYWDLRENIHIFTHPTLETLTVRRARLDERGFDSLERPHSTALKTLHLIECDINDDALADIMEFPAALREFHMTHTSDPRPELEEGSDEINEFVMALRPCADSLETIDIDHPTLGGRKVLRMRDFGALRTLRLNYDTQLFGRTSRKPRLHSVGLPPQLETLEFTGEIGNDETVTELFAAALENIEYMARNLKTLIVAEGPRGLPQQIVGACRGKKFHLLTRRLDDEDEEED